MTRFRGSEQCWGSSALADEIYREAPWISFDLDLSASDNISLSCFGTRFTVKPVLSGPDREDRRGEASAVAFVGVERRDADGWMYTDDRTYTVKSARAMQIYRVTVNTAAEHIIHSGAYLAERIHAARARFSLQPLNAAMKQPAIFAGRERRRESAGTRKRGGPEVQGPTGNGTVSAPGSPFAKEIKRFRAICLDAKHEAHACQLPPFALRSRVTGPAPVTLFPSESRLHPPHKDIRIHRLTVMYNV
ncbi:hypothetical protein DBV15_10843 [Temnothorax longispinosus]|uniref:Uncharacterized protein n=1 Tax=Temnothorax longispinosus TaxID=300112 RepID=A0A4S2KMM0_9HYME|nr:hypothetical protein DBV15_10843 [Temnothorax longispinosus]